MSIFENTVMVDRKPSFGQLFLKYLFIVLAVLSGIGTIMITPLGLFIPTVLFIVFAYLTAISCDVEYEYTFIEGELDIDKIKAKRKRKKIAKIDLDDLVIIAPENAGELNQFTHNGCKSVDATSRKEGSKIYYVVYRNNNNNEMVAFEPDQKMLDAIRVKHSRKVIL